MLQHKQSPGSPGSLSRRDFLRVGAVSAGVAGLALGEQGPLAASTGAANRCILLLLVGGPSQLDTWDPKPGAPENVRSPFRPIHTNVPGIDLCETFPRMARRADRFALVRSVHHSEAPLHEAGLQLVQTGRLLRDGSSWPHYGAVVSRLRGRPVGGLPPFVILPGPIGALGVDVSKGQTAGALGRAHEPVFADPAMDNAFDLGAEPERVRQQYGATTFGRACLLTRRLIEHGVQMVVVNMFTRVFEQLSWDCHADGGALPTTLEDYRNFLCPLFDQVYTALLDDLEARGLLPTTLVLATGEHGRTPQRNLRGGRDHWPGCWTALFAGGGVRGGQVVGASDRWAAEPRDRPVTPAEMAASVYHALGIDPQTSLPGPDGGCGPLVDARPIQELFDCHVAGCR